MLLLILRYKMTLVTLWDLLHAWITRSRRIQLHVKWQSMQRVHGEGPRSVKSHISEPGYPTLAFRPHCSPSNSNT
jgi:hypothetical protein